MNAIFDVLTRPWFSDFDKLENSNSENWNWVRATKTTQRSRRNNVFTYNKRTQEVYWEDTPSKVATKCFTILFGNPIHTAGRALFYTAKMPFEFIRVFYQYTNQFITDLKDEGFCKSFYENFKNSIIDLTSSVASDLWNVVRAPWYGLGYEIAALEAFLSDPYRGRTKISHIEKNWNHGISHFFDALYQVPDYPSCNELWEGVKKVRVFYLAHCMQCQGNINDTIQREGEEARLKFEILEQVRDPKDFTRKENLNPDNYDIPCCPLIHLCYY